MIKLIWLLAELVVITWLWASMAIYIIKISRIPSDHKLIKVIRVVWAELRPFYLPAVVVDITFVAVTSKPLSIWDYLWMICAMGSWYIFKDEDKDDRWKKRRKKVADKIKRVGAKLIIVPEGSQ